MKLTFALPVLAFLLVSGCQRPSAGDLVMATVDGSEVTRRDVQADLQANHVAIDHADPRIQSAVVRGVVDRKLLAAQSRRLGLDQGADFRALQRRVEESMLVGRLLSGWRAEIAAPSGPDVRHLINENPQMFADRRVYLADEIRTDAAGLDGALDRMRSLDAAAEYLRQRDHPFRRGSAAMDTFGTGLRTADQLAHLDAGQTFTSRLGGTLIIRSLVRSTVAPIDGEQATAIAIRLLEQRAYRQLVRARLDQLRASARISYASHQRLAG